MIADAIFMYNDKRPLVMPHESLAEYMDISADRPVIAKIHRDLMLRPNSSGNETDKITEKWKPVLKRDLGIYTPIVIGYGGNDESLMKILEEIVEENGTEKPIYWCYLQDKLNFPRFRGQQVKPQC
jgi:hypothetical protein